MNRLVGLAFIASITFSGCGNSMPECDDKEVLDLVTKITQNMLGVSYWCREERAFCEALKYDYSAFMINSVDKETKKISCKAQVSTKQPHIQTLLPILKEELLKVSIFAGFMGAGAATDGLGEATSLFVAEEYFIKYTAQATQDGKVYVEVLGYK